MVERSPRRSDTENARVNFIEGFRAHTRRIEVRIDLKLLAIPEPKSSRTFESHPACRPGARIMASPREEREIT